MTFPAFDWRIAATVALTAAIALLMLVAATGYLGY